MAGLSNAPYILALDIGTSGARALFFDPTGQEVEGSGDEATGVNMLRRALEEPTRRLAENAGREGSVIVDLIRRKQAELSNTRIGYDVLTGETADMNQRGIIDPAKVTRTALENAASIAGMILTTEALITDIPEKDRKFAGPPGGMPEY